MSEQPVLTTVSSASLLDPRHEGFLTPGGKRRLYDSRTFYFAALAFWGVIAAVLGLATLLIGVFGQQTQSLLDASGATSEAIVVDRETMSFATSRSGEQTTEFQVIYQFSAGGADGGTAQVYLNTSAVSEETYHRTQVGDTIAIRYLPENPSISAIVGDTDTHAQGLMAVGVVLLVASPLLWCWMIWLRMRNRRLTRDGQVIEGRILGAKMKRAYRAGYYMDISYQFFSPQGKELKGTATSMRPEHYDSLSEGTPVAVLWVNDKLYRLL